MKDLIIFQIFKCYYICGRELCSVCSYKDKLEIKVLLMDEDSGSILGRFVEHCVLHSSNGKPWEVMNILALCVV